MVRNIFKRLNISFAFGDPMIGDVLVLAQIFALKINIDTTQMIA